MTHTLKPLNPITYNLSSGKPVSKFAFQVHNLYRYLPGPTISKSAKRSSLAAADAGDRPVGLCTLESS
jgi:hypothetical protein